MKVIKALAVAGTTGVVLAGMVSTPAFAWHPKGEIKKYVENTTAKTARADADTAATAVAAKPGDVLKYIIEIKNTAAPAQNEWNDLHFIKLTDTLPAGVELVDKPSTRTISQDLPMLKPGQKHTVEFMVKVTSNKDKDLIDNKACFTGDSKVKDNKQQGCDTAKVKVTVPEQPKPKPEEPKPQPKPEQPKPEAPKVETPVTLPETGASSLFAPLAAVGAGVAGYTGRLIFLKRRQK